MTALEFAGKILTIALQVPMSVTSWGRTAARNAEVGGTANSYHKTWCAVDVALDNRGRIDDLRVLCERQGLEVIDEGNHIHIEPRDQT